MTGDEEHYNYRRINTLLMEHPNISVNFKVKELDDEYETPFLAAKAVKQMQ